MKTILFPLLLVFYEITTYLSNDMYLPALPQMMRDLSISSEEAQLTLTTWFLGMASMPLIIGAISDRYGRRIVLLLGGVIYVSASILCATTSSLSGLLIGRILEGSMVASMLVPGYSCIHELYDQKEAIKILALMGSITIIAPALGPLFGAFVLLFSNWRGIFWIIAISAFIGILLLTKWMPETNPPENRRVIHIKTLLRQYGRILINKKFVQLSFVLGFYFSGFLAWITAGPLLVISHFHYSAITFGFIQALVFATNILGNQLVKYLLEPFGVDRLIRVGLGTTLIGGIFILIFALMAPQSLLLFILGMMIYSFGSGLCFSPLNRIIIEASDEPMGVRMAFFSVFITGFAALGSAMAIVFFDGSIPSLAYIISISVGLSCLVRLIG